MYFADKITAKNPRTTADGYLVADAPVARTGVQLYRGEELGRPDLQFVRLYRPESEVFSRDSINSYTSRPMTNDHPEELVDSENWKQVAIGQTGEDVVRDGETVRVPLVLMDQAAINDFNAGKRELSMGYTADIEFLDSEAETDDGMKYDAVQKNLRMNHLALVQKGRAGIARIGDNGAAKPQSKTDKQEQSTMSETTIVVDGVTITTTSQGAEVIAKLQQQIDDSEKVTSETEAAHAEAIAAKDAEIATRDATIEELNGKILSDSEMAERVEARAALVSLAGKFTDADVSALSEDEIKTAVVVAKCGDAAVEDKSQAYIDARFDVLVETLDADGKETSADPVKKAVADAHQSAQATDVDTAYAGYINDLQTAHMGNSQ